MDNISKNFLVKEMKYKNNKLNMIIENEGKKYLVNCKNTFSANSEINISYDDLNIVPRHSFKIVVQKSDLEPILYSVKEIKNK